YFNIVKGLFRGHFFTVPGFKVLHHVGIPAHVVGVIRQQRQVAAVRSTVLFHKGAVFVHERFIAVHGLLEFRADARGRSAVCRGAVRGRGGGRRFGLCLRDRLCRGR